VVGAIPPLAPPNIIASGAAAVANHVCGRGTSLCDEAAGSPVYQINRAVKSDYVKVSPDCHTHSRSRLRASGAVAVGV
jgi:hypothetical protein